MILQDITTRKREREKISRVTHTSEPSTSQTLLQTCLVKAAHTHTRHSPYSAHFISYFIISKSRKITSGFVFFLFSAKEDLDAIHSNLMWLEWAAAAHLVPISEREKKKVHECVFCFVDSRPTRKAAQTVWASLGIDLLIEPLLFALADSSRDMREFWFFLGVFFCCWCRHDIFLTSTKFTTLFHHLVFSLHFIPPDVLHREFVWSVADQLLWRENASWGFEWMDDVIERDNDNYWRKLYLLSISVYR